MEEKHAKGGDSFCSGLFVLVATMRKHLINNKKNNTKANLSFDQIMPAAVKHRIECFRYLSSFLSPTCARLHTRSRPHAAGRAHANLLTNALHRTGAPDSARACH